jgi:hypothetical protein
MSTPDLFAIAAEINKAAETEISKEDAAEERIIAFARKFGIVERCGDGSGDNGPINTDQQRRATGN